MYNNIIAKLNNYHSATKIPVVLYTTDNQKICSMPTELNATLAKWLSIDNFSTAKKKLFGNKNERYIITVSGNLSYILVYASIADASGYVVAGPIVHDSTNVHSNTAVLDNVPHIADLGQIDSYGKLLLCYVNDRSDVDSADSFFVEQGFNPYAVEDFFIDSREYMTELFDYGNIITSYDTMTLAIINRDSKWIKKYLKQCLEIAYPTPLRRNKISSLSGFRIKQNIVLNFFACMNYVLIQQRVKADFYMYLSSLIITEFEKCNSETDLLITTYELIDHIFQSMKNECECNNKIINDACFYIGLNLIQKLTLDEVASVVGVSPKYLSKLFHDEMGIPYKEYIINAKIVHAKELLRYTQKSNVDIAIAIGIELPNNFTAFFRKHTGMTPLQYKNSIH